MITRAAFWLIVQGVALAVTGFLAAAGMTFVCLLRNRFLWHIDESMDLGPEVPDAFYAALFVVMVIWLTVACVFAYRNRTPLGLTLSVVAFAVFAMNAHGVFRLAYPVCNAF